MFLLYFLSHLNTRPNSVFKCVHSSKGILFLDCLYIITLDIPSRHDRLLIKETRKCTDIAGLAGSTNNCPNVLPKAQKQLGNILTTNPDRLITHDLQILS